MYLFYLDTGSNRTHLDARLRTALGTVHLHGLREQRVDAFVCLQVGHGLFAHRELRDWRVVREHGRLDAAGLVGELHDLAEDLARVLDLVLEAGKDVSAKLVVLLELAQGGLKNGGKFQHDRIEHHLSFVRLIFGKF